MNHSPSSPLEQQELEEQLVAYLDGELDEAALSKVEQLLSSDPRAQSELARLERSWNLLDRLPRAEVDDTFTRSTVEMIAMSAAEEITAKEQEEPRRKRRLRLAIVGGLLAAAVGGFFAVSALWPNPNQKLLEDLPVVENLEAFRQAESVEFLRLLKSAELFPEEDNREN